MSHCTTGPISSDCPDLLNRSYSLRRCASRNHHGCYQDSPYTSMTNGYASNHHLMHSGGGGSVNVGQNQYQNGNKKYSSCSNNSGYYNNRHSHVIGAKGSGSGGTGGLGKNAHGRLQKSLSFAFQTPSMMNEESCNPCQCYGTRYSDRYYSR